MSDYFVVRRATGAGKLLMRAMLSLLPVRLVVFLPCRAIHFHLQPALAWCKLTPGMHCLIVHPESKIGHRYREDGRGFPKARPGEGSAHDGPWGRGPGLTVERAVFLLFVFCLSKDEAGLASH